MKRRLAYLAIASVLATVAGACGEVPSEDTPDAFNPDTPDAAPPADAPPLLWTLEHNEPVSLGDWFRIAMLGDTIYFSRDASDGSARFMSYRAGTGVQDHMTQPDLCACGYGGDLVAGDSALYLFANEGHVFEPATLMWRPLFYPFENQRGEAAASYLQGAVAMVGGRGPIATGQAYDPAADIWIVGMPPDYPRPFDSGKAVSSEGRMYVLGGYDNSGPLDTFYSWLPGDADWTPLPNMPQPGIQSAAVYQQQIWAHNGNRASVFDLGTEQWLPTSNLLPFMISRGAVVSGVDNGGAEMLYAVEVRTGQVVFWRYNR